jgi:hypothetical protein
MTDCIICIGSIEHATSENLEKKPITWIRFKIICEADGRTLWHDTCRTVADVAQTMADNDIKYHSIIHPEPNIFIVRAKPESLAELKDWPSDEMCVRTFYTLCNKDMPLRGISTSELCSRDDRRQSRLSEPGQSPGEENNDLFNTDSCWLSNGLVELKTIDYWYRMVKQMELGAKV